LPECDPLQARSRSLDPGGGGRGRGWGEGVGGRGSALSPAEGGGRGPSGPLSKVSSRKIDELTKTT
jgi:hypothetical protein